MRTMEVTHSELGFGNLMSQSPQNEKTNVFNELLQQTQNELLENPTIKEIIEKRSDETNIFEHYEDITKQNFQFIIGNLDKFAEQINNFIIQIKEGKLNIDQRKAYNYFEGIFAALDKKYGTQLKVAFQDAFKQLISIREYTNNGDLLNDTIKLLKNFNELGNSSISFNNKLAITKFFEHIGSSEEKIVLNDNQVNIIQQKLTKEVLEIDNDRIIKNLELKNMPLRENLSQNISKLNDKSDSKEINSNNNTVEISNTDNVLDIFDQNENSFNQNPNTNQHLSFRSPILNSSLMNNISNPNIQHFSEIFEQSIENYTFSNVKIENFGKNVGGFIGNIRGENQATAKLILEPQWLGTVIVDVLMKNDVAEIKIKARSKETVEAIEKQISVLKEKLSEHGITTGKIDITDENYEERNLGNNTEQQKNKKEEREFLNSFLKTESNNEINQEEANDIFRLWMKKIIEKYV